MNPVNVSLFVFACAFGSSLFGMFIKRLLPAHHVSPESKEVVRVAMRMVATTVALVLGLLVYSAKIWARAEMRGAGETWISPP